MLLYTIPSTQADLGSSGEAVLGPEAKDTGDQEEAQDIERS